MMKHSVNFPVLAYLAPAAFVVLLSACSSENKSVSLEAPPLPILVQVVDEVQVGQELTRSVPGVLVPRYAADISFQVAGKINQRLVDVGQHVKAGDLLLRLDDKDYALALSAAEADSVQASADERRFKNLLDQGVISTSEFERASVRAEAARAQFQLAKNRVQYSSLTAPYDGVVTAMRVEAGQVVGEGMPVLALARTNDIEVEVDLAEGLAAEIERYRAVAQLSGNEDMSFSLSLRELSPAASQPMRTYKARFSFDELSAHQLSSLRMGMTAQVRFSASVNALGDSKAAVLLPATALITTTDKPQVWLLADGAEHVLAHEVTVVAFHTDTVLVSGIPANSQVVIAGVQKLDEKLRVRAIKRTGAGVDYAAGER